MVLFVFYHFSIMIRFLPICQTEIFRYIVCGKSPAFAGLFPQTESRAIALDSINTIKFVLSLNIQCFLFFFVLISKLQSIIQIKTMTLLKNFLLVCQYQKLKKSITFHFFFLFSGLSCKMFCAVYKT